MPASNKSSISRLIRKVRRAIQRRWGSKEYVVYFKAPGVGGREGQGRSDDVIFRVATREDIPWMSKHLDVWARWSYGGQDAAPQDVLAEQFDQGDITIVGTENKPDGAIVYMLSVCRDELALRLMGNAFTPGSDVSVRRAWVAPSHRRRGIGLAGQAFADAEAARQGLTGIWGFVQKGNTASRKLQEKLGFVWRGEIRLITRLGRRWLAVKLDDDSSWRKQRIDSSTTHL